MVLLTAPFDPNRTGRALRLPRTGLVATIASLAVLSAGVLMWYSGGVARDLGRGIASGAAHSTLLFAGWVIAGGSSACLALVIYAAAILCLASIATTFTVWGALL